MKKWIKAICITSFVFQIAACGNSTQTKMIQDLPKQYKTGYNSTWKGKVLLIFRKLIRENKGLETVKGKVLHIKDGDTIDVNVKGQKQTVRLLLLDTPESVSQKFHHKRWGKKPLLFKETARREKGNLSL